MDEKKSVIFFDGVCGLCNSFVDFVMARDHKEKYLFSPLQSEYAAKKISKEYLELGSAGEFKSILLLENEHIYQQSEAVLRVLVGLGGLWRGVAFFYLIPSLLRDPIYNFIASNRYRWFGKKNECRLPTPEERKRFIL